MALFFSECSTFKAGVRETKTARVQIHPWRRPRTGTSTLDGDSKSGSKQFWHGQADIRPHGNFAPFISITIDNVFATRDASVSVAIPFDKTSGNAFFSSTCTFFNGIQHISTQNSFSPSFSSLNLETWPVLANPRPNFTFIE